jgi:hypothetical protein
MPILAKLHPSGKVTWGAIANRSPLQPIYKASAEEREEARIFRVCLKHHGSEKTLAFKTSHSIGLSNASNLTNPGTAKAPRLNLTRRGRGRLREGCAVLDRYYGKGLIAFDTLTFPPELDLYHTGERVSAAIHEFFKGLRYYYLKAGVKQLWCYVVELHPKRSVREGVPIPHVHVCRLGASRRWQPIISKLLLMSLWKKAVLRAYKGCGVTGDTSFSSSTSTEWVQKSVGAYLGKYLSKGCKNTQESLGLRSHLSLGQWWGMSALLLLAVRKDTLSFSGSEAYLVLDLVEGQGEYRHIKRCLEVQGEPKVIGGVFYPMGAGAKLESCRIRSRVKKERGECEKIRNGAMELILRSLTVGRYWCWNQVKIGLMTVVELFGCISSIL